MTQHVEIITGTYRINGEYQDMAGQVFPLVKPFRVGAQGGYVTVDGTPVAGCPDRNIRIRVDSEADYRVLDETPAVMAMQPRAEETDQQIMDRLRARFDILTEMTKAVKSGAVRSMIVSGPPGVGKSHGVEEVLDRYQLVETLGGEKKYEIVKGAMSPIGLYCKLFQYRAQDNVLVF